MRNSRKINTDPDLLQALYFREMKSISMVAMELGLSRSTVRSRLAEMGILRSSTDGIRAARDQGRLVSGNRGKKRVFTSEWKRNIAEAAKRRGERTAKGLSLKSSGYLEHTRGIHKGRRAHVVIMELAIGRKLARSEVVHHIDHNRVNNDLSNLALMTRAQHAALHARENYQYRKRTGNGQFK